MRWMVPVVVAGCHVEDRVRVEGGARGHAQGVGVPASNDSDGDAVGSTTLRAWHPDLVTANVDASKIFASRKLVELPPECHAVVATGRPFQRIEADIGYVPMGPRSTPSRCRNLTSKISISQERLANA